MKARYIYIPDNLDLKQFDQFRVEVKWKLLFFISTVYFRRVCDKRFNKRDYIPINFRVMGQTIRPNDVKRVRNILIELGIIECDFKKIYGKKSFGHRLTEKFRNAKTIRIQYPKPLKIHKMITNNDNHKYIADTLTQLTIEPEALEYIVEKINTDVDEYNCAMICCDWIAGEQWFFSTDDKTGRVFHNASNLNKELRPYLRLKGSPLVEVDISNCQPLLLYTLYPEKYSPEARRFKSIVESGKFYELLQLFSGICDREKIKKQFLTYLFAKNHITVKAGVAFKVEFPELAAIIHDTKIIEHNALALALQKLEADLVIQTVVGICKERHIPVITIHDSIMTLPEYEREIRAMLIDECAKAYKITPAIKSKEFKLVA